MQATELIIKLSELIRLHGDCSMFSEVDWEEVRSVEFCVKGEHVAEEQSYFILR